MSDNRLTKREAAEVMGVSTRWVEINKEQFGGVEVGKASNGRPDIRYDIAKLPVSAQQAWAEKGKVVELVPGARTGGQMALALTMPTGPNLSDENRAEAERRYTVIEPLVDERKAGMLAIQYPLKRDLVDYLAKAHKVKSRTIYAWLQSFKASGLPGLVSKDRSDKGKPRAMSPAALDFLLAAAMPQKGVYGVLSVREIFRAYEEERVWRGSHAGRVMGDFEQSKYGRYLDEEGRLKDSALLPAVAYETFRVWFNRIPEVVRTMAREGEEAFHNTQEIISFRALSEIRPLQYVVMDHRVLDIFCLVRAPGHPGWKLARPWLTAAIDMRTRKWLAWVIVETPSSDSIAAVLKRVFLDHGLAECVYWDNGKDFRCEWLEGGHAAGKQSEKVGELDPTWRGVLSTLGVRVHHAIVKRARSKIIEPNFGNIANFDKTLPEYCGHKPTARPERFGELVKQHEQWAAGKREATPFRTIEQVAALYTDAIEQINEREHSGEGMSKITPSGRGWMCPNEAWEILVRNVERRTVDPQVLHFCFAKRRELMVRHGEVKTTFAARDYHYRLTGNDVALMALNGQTVEFAYDPMDLGEAAIYYQSRFVGLANCVELRRMGESAFVDDEKNRRAARREVKKFIEAVHNAIPVADPETRIARRKQVMPVREMVARIAAPVAMPAAIVEAEQASRAERQFRFDQAPAAIASVETPASSVGDDDEFRFFGD